MTTNTSDRTTKYVTAVRDILHASGHATHTEILAHLRDVYPDVSATTVHRVTARLLERGEIRLAPPSADNAMRFDANSAPHDHFLCTSCTMLRDTLFGQEIRTAIEQTISDGCSISGNLVVSGMCKKCRQQEEL